ncbi:MAG: sulfotransferase [Alcanivorax sp.]|nr:sulfotransferase [Alcanivorax sp.]
MKKVVIIGCPRSGTTLLARLLEDRLGLAAPIEPHFIEYFSSYRVLFQGRLSVFRRTVLINAVFAFLRIWLPRNNPGHDMREVARHSLLCLEMDRRRLVGEAEDFSGLMVALMDAYARAMGQRGWVDKSAYFFPPHIPRYAALSEDIFFIHLVRDGRDVCASWLSSWFGPPSAWMCALLWRRHVSNGDQWLRAHPDRGMQISYEALTADPERIMAEVAGKIGMPLQPASRENAMVRMLSRRGEHARLCGAVVANSGQWKQALSEQQQEIFHAIAGDALVRSGYPVDETISVPQIMSRVRAACDWLRPSVMTRRSKRLVPLYAIVMAALGYWFAREGNNHGR